MKIINKKKISLFEAVSIWIWWMVGWGIFAVLGEAVMMWHSATPIAFLLAWIIALLTSYSYAKLSVKYPSEWWTVTFILKAFWRNIFSKSINIILWLSYLVTIALYALAFWSYSATFFPDTMQWWLLTHSLIIVAILIPMVLNMMNAKIIAKFESYIVAIKMLILIIVIIFWLWYVDSSHFNNIKSIAPFSVVIAGMIIFIAYEWFELIANSAKDIKDPEKNLPRAYYISVISVIILYVLISIITVWSISESLIMSSSDYALAEASKPALWELWFKLVAISAILATLSAINATIYWNARLWFSLAVDRQLPKALNKKIWNDSYLWVIIVGIISMILANIIDLSSIAVIASAGFLLIFIFVNFAALKLNSKIWASKIITSLACILSSLALTILLIETYWTNKESIYIFLLFIIFAIIFESTYWKTKDEYMWVINKVKYHFKKVYLKIINK